MDNILTSVVIASTMLGYTSNDSVKKEKVVGSEWSIPADNKFDEEEYGYTLEDLCDIYAYKDEDEEGGIASEGHPGWDIAEECLDTGPLEVSWITVISGVVAILVGSYWLGTLFAGYWYACGPILGFIICIALSWFSWKEQKLENLNAAKKNSGLSGMDWVAVIGTAALVWYTLWDAGVIR